jgi:hypothetical protein
MAHKLINRVLPQEVRFANRETAERYAIQFGGGLSHWTVVVVRDARPVLAPLIGRGRRAC